MYCDIQSKRIDARSLFQLLTLLLVIKHAIQITFDLIFKIMLMLTTTNCLLTFTCDYCSNNENSI